ncbi:MAG TPA: bifunctional adenosylcobinamide kinase/adenosylcobinamide-phosphate guanylyltransferase [Propionibacteriaceae bacterium]
MTSKILVTGGVRSGKSRHAEHLFADEPGVTYVAPGAVPDPVADPEWAARVAEHQLRRPPHWSTVETRDVAAALRGTEGTVLVDCLGTWLTATIDAWETWDQPLRDWRSRFDEELAGLVEAWGARTSLTVAVTNEVGWGLVSEHRSGRIFTDLLGRTNAEVAAVSDQVHLVVAGRVLML